MSSEPALPRDFVGYGANPPDPRWPGGARLALNIVVNVEEGSEPSVPDGDAVSETGLAEGGGAAFEGRDLAAESMFEYGSRVGFWRLLRILRAHDAPATFFTCSQVLERNAEIAAAIRDAVASGSGDVCGHGQRWERHQTLSREAEEQAIATAFASLTRHTGTEPMGWYCRYAPTVHTRDIVVAHGGFAYDSDAYNDELPYWTHVRDRAHLVIPYSLAINDAKFARGAIATAGQFFEYLKDSFDMLYAEGETAPRMMSVGLHCRVAGHPGRAVALTRFLEHVAAHEGVWLCKRGDIARHWARNFPAPAKGVAA
ncbi:polysaccharide deacetylase family protein [Acuticoccus sp. MNP-M23]|uniref:polysaccharide deacetylase family protein n=1 Tax=Acuticoccus sp. MNP-M23 TaxID=3072793 RepID=UPI002815E3DC|nr:polysaccharide deacetylase family protein [Acuticoccus sp. MNP-M23]WMS43549.1 polysaccharide deacetylase family protein [Acuticoccus sp. MNP-M23]